MEERRKYQRARMLKGGHIHLGKAAVPCTVRNLSAFGACLQVQTTEGLPSSFGFSMAGREAHDCRVAWRNDTRMGVSFSA